MLRSAVAVLIVMTVCQGAIGAADQLPLKQGLYVPVNRPCNRASNAEILNYWGGNSSFGSSQASCTITKLTRSGKVFTIDARCVDIQSGDQIVVGPTVVTIDSPTRFNWAGTSFRHCGEKVPF